MTSVLSKQSMLDSFDGKLLRQKVTCFDAKLEMNATKIITDYSSEPMHFHENAHLNFILNGGIIDKRQKSESERHAGDLMFFHAGEPHQTFYKHFPEINVSLEINESLFADKPFGKIGQIESLSKNVNTKFLAIKIYKELAIRWKFTR